MYPNSVFYTASAVQETFSETKNRAAKDYREGEERTVYAGKALLTVSNEKEHIVFLPYVQVKENVRLAYIAPKTAHDTKQSKKVQFLQLDKDLMYPLFVLTPLLQEQIQIADETAEENPALEAVGNSLSAEDNIALNAPVYFALVGDIYLGLQEDLSLSDTLYLYHKLEFVPLEYADKTEKIQFAYMSRSKKTASSENNYSIVYAGKQGNILQFRKVFLKTDKKAEYCEVKMTSPQIKVFGHNLLVQTATREALHCVIKN